MSNNPINQTVVTALTELGLAENDAKLYQILLNTPDATIHVLQQKSPFSRTMLYYVLNSLEEWELLAKKEVGKKTVYNAAPPEQLEELIESQEKELKRGKQLLGTVIHDLRSAYRLAHNKPGVKFYEGKEGMIEAYESLLDIRQPIQSIEDSGNMMDFFPDYVARYVKKRVERKIYNRAIAPDTNKINNPDPAKLIDSRLIPAAEFPFSMDIKICADMVQIATLEEGQGVAVQIRHPIIAQNFKVMFGYTYFLMIKLVGVLRNFIVCSLKNFLAARCSAANVS